MTVFRGSSAVQRRRVKIGRGSSFYAVFVCCCVLVLSSLTQPVRAQGQVDGRVQPLLELDIAAQDLSDALELFSRSTGMAVLVDRELTRGRRAIRVQGRYSARDALNRMLTGSGLMARYARADAFTLQVAQLSDSPGLKAPGNPATGPMGRSFAAALQHAVEQGLCRSELTRPGNYRAVLQLWVGRDGNIQHSRLLGSTGDNRRDEALVESLGSTWVERPAPSSLRQPVTLLLTPDTTGKTMDCNQRQGASGA